MDCTVLLINSLNRQKGLRRVEHEINERCMWQEIMLKNLVFPTATKIFKAMDSEV